MRSKLAIAAATGGMVALAALPANAQQPIYSGSGWGPIAAQAANAVTKGTVVTPTYGGFGLAGYAYAPATVASTGYNAFAYEPGYVARTGYNAFAYEPGYVARTGYNAFAYSPGDVVTASWFSRGLGAFAYAPAANLAVANYGLGMSAGAACARRFRSYDASSGTYLGYDGMRHPCP